MSLVPYEYEKLEILAFLDPFGSTNNQGIEFLGMGGGHFGRGKNRQTGCH